MTGFLCVACARVLQPAPWERFVLCACGQDYRAHWEEFALLTEPRSAAVLVDAWPIGEAPPPQD